MGTQYRSAIFYSSAEQKSIAEAYIKQLNDVKVYSSPIVTQVVELKAFYPAEGHHQNYCNLHPYNPYVQAVAMPKVDKTLLTKAAGVDQEVVNLLSCT